MYDQMYTADTIVHALAELKYKLNSPEFSVFQYNFVCTYCQPKQHKQNPVILLFAVQSICLFIMVHLS